MRPIGRLALTLALLILATPGSAAAQQDRVDPEFQAMVKKIGSKPEREAQLPLDAVFTDQDGQEVTLGQYFGGSRPILLNLLFFDCQTICEDVTAGLRETLANIDWTLGDEYNVVTLSFDPKDETDFATLARDTSLERYGRDFAAGAWPHLTGEEAQIQRVTNVLGFQYEWNEEIGQYAHPAVIYILTPDGRLSRYYQGFGYASDDIKYSLMAAGEGTIGSIWDHLSFFCLAWDPQIGQWIPAAWRVMQIGGGLTLLALGLVVWGARRAGRRRLESEAKNAEHEGNPETLDVSLGTQP